MADYHSPTVVQPNIPAMDMTPLERLILDLVFDAESEACGIYYHSWCGPSDVVTLPVHVLRTACAASHERGVSSIGSHVIALLAQYDADAGGDPLDDIDGDLADSDTGWDQIFQDIVRRSVSINEIVVMTAFTCTKMRPDGFGGSVMLITADAIRYQSTTDILEEFWNEAAKAAAARQVPTSTDSP